MKFARSSSRWIRCLVCTISVILLSGVPSVRAKEEDARDMLSSLKESYDNLPDAGKFATGAVAGFGVTRFTVNKVVTVVKLAGAAFIGSEALKYSGALDHIDDDYKDTAQHMKNSLLKNVDRYRVTIRNRFKPESLRQQFKDAVEKDRMATFGFATGCFVGCVL